MVTGALPAVAALCGDHDVCLLDENVEDIEWASLSGFDIVGVTAMSVQRTRVREILLRLGDLNIYTVVGGPLVSVQEQFFEGLCDVMFIGEAETTWPQFSAPHPSHRRAV